MLGTSDLGKSILHPMSIFCIGLNAHCLLNRNSRGLQKHAKNSIKAKFKQISFKEAFDEATITICFRNFAYAGLTPTYFRKAEAKIQLKCDPRLS